MPIPIIQYKEFNWPTKKQYTGTKRQGKQLFTCISKKRSFLSWIFFKSQLTMFKWIHVLIGWASHMPQNVEVHPWKKNVCFSPLRNSCCYRSSFSQKICRARCRSNKLYVTLSHMITATTYLQPRPI